MRSTKSEKEKEEIFREYFSIYYDKGFEIYGVSLDSKKENWVKAIEDKKMKWPNVSDLKQWNCGPAQDYGVRRSAGNEIIRTLQIMDNIKPLYKLLQSGFYQ